MTVIAWDGKMLAADRAVVYADMLVPSCKIQRHGERVLAWTGPQEYGIVLATWFRNGANPDAWPAFQRTDDWCRLIVASADGVVCYETEPIPQESQARLQAWGSGRDFALGAMAMGASAYAAVLVANSHSINCGCGVDAYEFCPQPCYRNSVDEWSRRPREGWHSIPTLSSDSESND